MKGQDRRQNINCQTSVQHDLEYGHGQYWHATVCVVKFKNILSLVCYAQCDMTYMVHILLQFVYHWLPIIGAVWTCVSDGFNLQQAQLSSTPAPPSSSAIFCNHIIRCYLMIFSHILLVNKSCIFDNHILKYNSTKHRECGECCYSQRIFISADVQKLFRQKEISTEWSKLGLLSSLNFAFEPILHSFVKMNIIWLLMTWQLLNPNTNANVVCRLWARRSRYPLLE